MVSPARTAERSSVSRSITARGGRREDGRNFGTSTASATCHSLKTAGLLIAEKDENGETVYRRKSDLRRAKLEAEEKSLEALQAAAGVSTRVESPGGPVPRSSNGAESPDGLVGEAIADLLSVGVW